MDQDPSPAPGPTVINPIKPVIVLLFLVMAAAEAAFSLGAAGYVGGPEAIGWRLGAIQQFAFSGDIFDWMIENWRWPLEQVMRLFTFGFVHGSLTHAAISGVIFLALGKMIGDAYGSVAAVVLFFVPPALGAIVYALFTESGTPLLGAFTVVYSYVGAFTYFQWIRLRQAGQPTLRAFSLIAALLAMQLIFGALYGTGPIWVAEVSAFAVALGLSPLLAPGGARRALAMLRRD